MGITGYTTKEVLKMAFENIKTNQQQNIPQPEPFVNYIRDLRNMIARIEHRAKRDKNGFGEFTGAVIVDPYAEYHPSDAMYWLEILSEARKLNEDMYTRLYYIRGGGTVLVPDARFGFAFEPIIGEYGWISIQFYDQEVQCLNEHAEQIMNLIVTAAQPF